MTPLLLSLALAVGAPNLKEPPPKGPPLVGRWECTSLTINGMADPQWQGQEWELTAGGGWVMYRDGKVIDRMVRTYKTDEKAGPGAVEFCERADGVAQPPLYKVDGDTLSLSIRFEKGGARPADFEPGVGLMTFTFRRVRSKD